MFISLLPNPERTNFLHLAPKINNQYQFPADDTANVMKFFLEDFEYHDSDQLGGLFRKYTNKISSIFDVYCSSTMPGRGSVDNVIDQSIESNTLDTTWLSDNFTNSSFTISFHRFPFQLKSYSIKARTDSDVNYPAEWKVEGSNDNQTWSFLHYHPWSDELMEPGIIKHWELNSSIDGCFRYFRTTKLGISAKPDGTYPLCFSMNKIEFFGQALIPFLHV